MAKFMSRSAAGTRAVARRILGQLLRAPRRPIIIALTGSLGSGKTTFAQGLAAGLGVRERVQSPTFVLAKWYALSRRHSLRHFIHVDAFRIRRAAEWRHLGLAAAFRDRDAIVVIEWASRVKNVVPRSATWVRFSHRSKSTRVIEVRSSQP